MKPIKILQNLNESSKIVDDKYIVKNIFGRNSLGNSVLNSYKSILNYMNIVDNIKPTLEESIGVGIYLFTLSEVDGYISSLIGSSASHCKVRYNACKYMHNYIPAVKDLRKYLFKLFLEESITPGMTEAQRISKYQNIYKSKYKKLPNNILGEDKIRDAAFNVWLER